MQPVVQGPWVWEPEAVTGPLGGWHGASRDTSPCSLVVLFSSECRVRGGHLWAPWVRGSGRRQALPGLLLWASRERVAGRRGGASEPGVCSVATCGLCGRSSREDRVGPGVRGSPTASAGPRGWDRLSPGLPGLLREPQPQPMVPRRRSAPGCSVCGLGVVPGCLLPAAQRHAVLSPGTVAGHGPQAPRLSAAPAPHPRSRM